MAWVARDNLHVTLKFLGGVEEARLPAVADALAAATGGFRPFDLEIAGLGAFPTATRPRVVWAGARAGAEALAALAGAVDARLAALGFAAEERSFTAHVTLGRVRVPRRDPALAAALGAGTARPFGTLRAERLSLMRSELSPRGARYTALAAFPLAPAA